MDYITFEARGRSVSDPEEIKTKGGAQGVKGSIAINKFVPKGDGLFETNTIFLNYECWDSDPETIKLRLAKGRTIKLTGEIKEDKWISSSNEKRKSVTLKVKTIINIQD